MPAAGAGVLTLVIVGLALWKMPEAGEDVLPRITIASGPQTAETNSRIRDADASVSSSEAEREYARADSLAAVSRAELSSNLSSTTRADTFVTDAGTSSNNIAPPGVSVSVRTAPTVASRPAVRPADQMEPLARAEPAYRTRASALLVSPLVNRSMRIGERVRLRWSVRTRGGSLTSTLVRFTSADATIASVDRRTGIITARAPGRARIIVDAGTAGMKEVTLDVRVPAASLVVTLPPGAGNDAARAILVTPRNSLEPQQVAKSESVLPTTPRPSTPVTLRRDSAAARVTSAIPSSSAAASARPPTAAASAADAPRIDLPTSAEVRGVAERLIANVGTGGVRNVDVMEFLKDGADHRLTLASTPVTTSVTPSSVRVTFAMRLTKYDGGGRPVTRIAPVTMDVDKRDRVLRASAVTIGAMRRP